MSKFIPKQNTMIVSKNSRKEQGDKKPDYNSKITLIEALPAGEYECAMWKKTGAYGEFMTGNIVPKQEKKPYVKREDNDFNPF